MFVSSLLFLILVVRGMRVHIVQDAREAFTWRIICVNLLILTVLISMWITRDVIHALMAKQYQDPNVFDVDNG